MHLSIRASALMAMLLGSCVALAAAEEVYKWTDAKGVTRYAREAPPDVKAEKVTVNPDEALTFEKPAASGSGRSAGSAKTPPRQAAGSQAADPTAEPYCPPQIPVCRKKGQRFEHTVPPTRLPPEPDEEGRIPH